MSKLDEPKRSDSILADVEDDSLETKITSVVLWSANIGLFCLGAWKIVEYLVRKF